MAKVPSRCHIVHDLIKNRNHEVGAEIGVYRGTLTEYLLTKLPTINLLHAVDSWIHYPDFTAILNPKGSVINTPMEDIFEVFLENTERFEKRLSVHKMSSEDAAEIIPDNSLDFIFIDANHAYDYVKADIIMWTPKVKSGGIIIGHDYNPERPEFGVIQAVNELIPDAKIKEKIWYTVKGD